MSKVEVGWVKNKIKIVLSDNFEWEWPPNLKIHNGIHMFKT